MKHQCILFCECDSTTNLTFLIVTSQTAILNIFNDSVSDIRLKNHIFLFKF